MVAKPPYKLQLTIDPPALFWVEAALLAHQAMGQPDSSALDLARRIVIAIFMQQDTLTIGPSTHAQEESRRPPAGQEDCPF